METRNREEFPFSLQMNPKGLCLAEVPCTVLHNAAHLYSPQAKSIRDPAET